MIGIVPHIVVEKSELSVRMIEQILDSLEIPDEHDVEIEGSEIHDAIPLVFFVKIPDEVDRVVSGLLGEELVDMSEDGESSAWGRERGMSGWFEKVISE